MHHRSFRVFAVCLMSAGGLSATFLDCVAATHLSRKGDYLNGTTNQTDSGVWEWEIGSGDTYSNIQGITADGLFHAAEAESQAIYGLGAFSTVNLLVGRYNLAPTLRPYSSEVDLMLDACAFEESSGLAGSGGSAYCSIGVQLYSRVVGDFPDPNANVDRHIPTRASIAGWDVALQIRAAWRAGFLLYAQGMLDRIFERRAEWEHALYGGFDYTELAHGALVRVMLEMHAAGDLAPADHAEALALAAALIAEQAADGSWGDGPDYQATAYVLLGLRADPWNFALPWQAAIIEGVDFLQANATPNPVCGWSNPPEIGEVNSEAMTALSRIQSLPFVDGFETGDSSAWTDDPGAVPLVIPRPVAFARQPVIPLR